MRLRGILTPLLGILLWGAMPALANARAWNTGGDASTAAAATSANGTQPATNSTDAAATSDATAAPAPDASVAASTASAPAAKPDPAPQIGASDEVPLAPAAATTGTLGLFTMETGQVLPKGGWSFSGYGNKFGRMPGSMTLMEYGLNFAYGITNWLNVYADFNPEEHARFGAPGQLSFNTPTTWPEYDSTVYRELCPRPSCRPAYVQDYPFAAHSGGGVGPVTAGLKFGILSEDRGRPFSLSVRNDFIIPTAISFTNVLQNEVQNGQFNDRIMFAASKKWSNWFLLTANAGVWLTPNPKTSVGTAMQQGQQFLASGGFILFPDRRVEIMNEYNATVFWGTRTPDNSFGDEEPVDGIWGVRLYPFRQLFIDAGFRYMLNLSNEISNDRAGFVIKAGTGMFPAAKVAPALLPPIAACSLNATSIQAGSTGFITVSTTASDPQGFPLMYSWTSSGGQVQGTGPQVRWLPGNAAPGNYMVTVNVTNDHGGSALCSVNPTVTAAPPPPPPPALPPTVTLMPDRNLVFVGEHVHWTATGRSPENYPLTYTWRANTGQLNASGTMGDLDTTGVNPGPITVTVRVEDGHGGAADAAGTITVQAPPPPPQASKVNSCDFRPAASSRVDNVCKRILDDIALRMQNEPRANVVILGFAPSAARNAGQLGSARGQNVTNYLTSKGVDRGRISVRPSTPQPGEQPNRIDIIWVPEGATY